MFARTLGLARLFTPTNASCAKIHQPVARLLRQPLLYLLWQHLIWHLVCVCVRVSGWSSQPYIVLCPVSKHKLAEMPQQDRFLWMTPLNSCKNNGWDGETELSSHAPARPQTARLKHVRHIETPRSAKHEANNRLYKIWPLWQNVSINIVFISVAKTSPHSCLHCPSAILQREGFWQHKGLEKHNTISVASAILTCNGLATKARLLLDIYVNHERCNGQLCLSLNGLIQKTAVHTGDAFYEHILSHMMFFNTMLVLSSVFSLFSVPYLNALTHSTCWKNKGTPEQLSLHFPRNGEMVSTAPPSNHLCRKLVRWFWMHSQQTWNHQLCPAPTAIKTQPLSKCMLLACAYQRVRQRNMGIPKKACQGFGQLFGKGRLFGRPFFKTNPQELSTLCIYPENSWTTQRMCQSTKYCLSQILPNTLSCIFGGTSH